MKKIIIVAAVVAMVLFIWIHSMIPTSSSAGESQWFTDNVIGPIFEKLFHTTITDSVVRKIAHVTEFTILGILLCVLFKGKAYFSVLAGFAVAFLDESIQILSKRGPMISDVWIDCSGVLIGSLIVAAIYALARGRKKTKDKQKNRTE